MDANDRPIETLRRKNARLEQRLLVAEGLLEVQEEAFALPEHPNNERPSDLAALIWID